MSINLAEEIAVVVTFYTYPGTRHWFFDANRVEAYDASAAARALGTNGRLASTPNCAGFVRTVPRERWY